MIAAKLIVSAATLGRMNELADDEWESLATSLNDHDAIAASARDASGYAYAYAYSCPYPAKMTFVIHQWLSSLEDVPG